MFDIDHGFPTLGNWDRQKVKRAPSSTAQAPALARRPRTPGSRAEIATTKGAAPKPETGAISAAAARLRSADHQGGKTTASRSERGREVAKPATIRLETAIDTSTPEAKAVAPRECDALEDFRVAGSGDKMTGLGKQPDPHDRRLSGVSLGMSEAGRDELGPAKMVTANS